MTLHLTHHRSAAGVYLNDPSREDWSGSWDEFCHWLQGQSRRVSPADPAAYKATEVRALVPGRFRGEDLELSKNGAPSISNANVEDTSFFVLDYDGVSPEDVDQVLDALRDRGLSFLMVPSFTGLVDEDRPRVHVYVPLAEPCPRDRHPGAYESFARSLGVSHDARCKNPARRFYFGQSLGPVVFDRNDGEGLDWRELGEPVPSGAEIVRYACAEPPPTKGDLRRVLRRWEKKGDKGRAVAGRVKLALLGHAYADPGERHTTNLQMTSWLAREYPRVDPGVFADQLIEPSWLEMYEDASGVQMARDRWVTQWQGQVDKLEGDRRAQAQVKLDVRGGRIRRARYGRTAEPYSVEELEAIATWLGEPVEHLARHAIVQYGGLFWILGLDRAGKPTFRGPRKSADIVEAARDLLAPFGDLISVETFDENSGKPRLKSRGELMHEHGFTVESTAGVFYGEPGLALEQGSMTLRYARLEPATGVWHEDVDKWLRAFAGDSYEALCDWLAVVTDLEEAAPALWMIGPHGSGKSLLARGVASMWGPAAAAVKGNELRNFNAELLQCPVVDFAENLGMSLDDFKEFVTCTEQRIEPKGRDKFPVSGALRIIISSNHENALRTKRALTKSDLGALSDRLIVVRVGEEAGRLHKDQAQTWLAGPFREHFTWLGEHRAVQSADRLACRALAAGVVDRLMDANEPLQRAAALVLGVLTERVMGFGEKDVVMVRDGKVLLQMHALVSMSEGKFTLPGLARALEPCGYAKAEKIRVDGGRRRYASITEDGFRALCRLEEEDPGDWLG